MGNPMNEVSNPRTPTNARSHLLETADIETSSDEYAQRFAGEIGEYFLDLQTKITLEFLHPWARHRVLDVGGGHAQLVVPLVHCGYNVTVTGSSEFCRKRLDLFLEKESFRFCCCDMLALPFKDKSFDVVIAFRLLPHVTQWQDLIAEMCRVSKNEVIVDYPDIASINIISKQFFRVKHTIEGDTRPYRCFRRIEIVETFAKYGFTQSSIRPEFFVPMVIHRILGRARISKTIEFISRMLGMTRLFGSPVILRLSRAQ